MSLILELLEALLGLLPSSKDSIPTWLVKVAVVALIIFLSLFFAYHVLINTTLGVKYGVQLNTKVPTMTHTEISITRKSLWRELRDLRIEDPNISGTAILMLIDKRTYNFPIKQLPLAETDLIIWEESLPSKVYTSLEIIEDLANNLQNEIQPNFDKPNVCLSSLIDKQNLALIKRSIVNFDSTHAVACPIYTFYNPHLIGFVASFFTLKPPYTSFYYEEKLRTTTKMVASHFRSMSRVYEILAD